MTDDTWLMILVLFIFLFSFRAAIWTLPYKTFWSPSLHLFSGCFNNLFLLYYDIFIQATIKASPTLQLTLSSSQRDQGKVILDWLWREDYSLHTAHCMLHTLNFQSIFQTGGGWPWLTCWDKSLHCPPLSSTGSCHWKLVASSSPSSILQPLVTRPVGPTSCQSQEPGYTLWIRKYQWNQLNISPLNGCIFI